MIIAESAEGFIKSYLEYFPTYDEGNIIIDGSNRQNLKKIRWKEDPSTSVTFKKKTHFNPINMELEYTILDTAPVLVSFRSIKRPGRFLSFDYAPVWEPLETSHNRVLILKDKHKESSKDPKDLLDFLGSPVFEMLKSMHHEPEKWSMEPDTILHERGGVTLTIRYPDMEDIIFQNEYFFGSRYKPSRFVQTGSTNGVFNSHETGYFYQVIDHYQQLEKKNKISIKKQGYEGVFCDK